MPTLQERLQRARAEIAILEINAWWDMHIEHALSSLNLFNTMY